MPAHQLSHVEIARRDEHEPEGEVAGATPEAVLDLTATLVLRARALYTLTLNASLRVTVAEGQIVSIAPYMIDAGGTMHTAWAERREPGRGLLNVERVITGVVGTGRPVMCGLRIKTNGGAARYADGYLAATAIPTPPMTPTPLRVRFDPPIVPTGFSAN